MKKISLITSVILIFSVFTCTVSADTLPSADRTPSPEPSSATSEIVPFGSTNCTLSFRRTSSSSARAQAAATRPGADWVKSTIQLQKKSGSSYVSKGSASKTFLYYHRKSYQDLFHSIIGHIPYQGNYHIQTKWCYQVEHLLQGYDLNCPVKIKEAVIRICELQPFIYNRDTFL